MRDIVTITMNPAIDVSTSVGQVEPVRKLRCTAARRDPGGGGVNVARVVGRLGGEVLAIYPAGGVIGRLLTELIAAEQAPSLPVAIAGETREDFTVIETTTGREYRFILPGPRLSAAEWRACLEAAFASGPAPRFLVASGSLPPGVPDDFQARLAAAARAAGTRMVLDSSGPALKAALAAGVYLVKPNLREMQELTGETLADDPGRLAAARRIIAAGGAEMVALTLGDAGALLVAADRAWRAPALAIRPVSSVGAGDSFLGAMVWALADGRAPEEALRYGMAAGSAALLRPGTELCRPADVRRLLPLVQIEAL